jgi:antitoxin ParD1/3/4
MATMNISLPETMREFVEDEIRGGGYMSASEYFRELVREQQRRRAQERLESLILEGVSSGPGIAATREYWDGLKADLLAKHGTKTANE